MQIFLFDGKNANGTLSFDEKKSNIHSGLSGNGKARIGVFSLNLFMSWKLFVFAFWLAVLNGPAVQAQVNWGFTAGGSLVGFYPYQQFVFNELWKYTPGHFTYLVSGLAGVAAEAPVNRHWLLDASLSYDGNGAHAAFDLANFGESLKSSFNMRLEYVRLPIEAIYVFNPGHKVRYMAGGGVYAALALRGTEKGSMISYQMFSGTDTSSIDNRIIIANKASTATDTSYPATVKPWDAGITVIAGIQWPHLRLSPSFSQGIINLFPDKVYRGKNKSFSLSLVYWIHRR
jgi:hypothetical protein